MEKEKEKLNLQLFTLDNTKKNSEMTEKFNKMCKESNSIYRFVKRGRSPKNGEKWGSHSLPLNKAKKFGVYIKSIKSQDYDAFSDMTELNSKLNREKIELEKTIQRLEDSIDDQRTVIRQQDIDNDILTTKIDKLKKLLKDTINVLVD